MFKDGNNYYAYYVRSSGEKVTFTFSRFIMKGDSVELHENVYQYEGETEIRKYPYGVGINFKIYFENDETWVTNNKTFLYELNKKNITGFKGTYKPVKGQGEINCDKSEYNFLTFAQREKIDGYLEKLKQLEWYDQLDGLICSEVSSYYRVYLFPSQSSTFINSYRGMSDGKRCLGGLLTNIKNTSENFRPFVAIDIYNSGDAPEIYYNDVSSNTRESVEMYTDNYPLYDWVPIYLTTVAIRDNSPSGEARPFTPRIEEARKYSEFYHYITCKLKDKLNFREESYRPPGFDAIPPTPGEGNGQNNGGQTDTTSCSNTGQFGGTGTPLKDIKLFLYANKVTKGTIKLSKPQVEVGTYATDWRPNPVDVTKSIEMMLEQIESERKGGRKNGKKRD